MTAQRNTHSPTPSITPDSSPEGFSDAARAEVIGKARERLIEDRGLNNDGVISLSAAQLKKLYALLTNRGAKTTLTIKIFNAVATSEPEKLPLLIDIMSRYNGNVGILDQFLRQLDQQNPFKAANEVQIVVVAPDPKGVVGASGHMLTNTTYWGVDPKVTSHTTGYRSGRMAILKILAAFAPSRLDSDKNTQRRERVISDGFRKPLPSLDFQDLSLADIESAERGPAITNSHIFNRNVAIYRELRQAIQEYSQVLADELYLRAQAEGALAIANVSGDPGRQFWGWFEEHFKETPNAPEGIVLAYHNLKDPLTNLTQEDELFLTRGLVAYQRLNTYIRSEIALKAINDDLQEYDRLPAEHQLAKDPAIEQARRRLIELGSGQKMTIFQFSTALGLRSLMTLRTEMNREILNPHRSEFIEALKRFRFVAFNEKNQLHEDMSHESVPVNRLKTHLYGAAIGVSEGTIRSKRSLISREEFQAIRTAHLHLLSDPQNEKILNAISISTFRDLVKMVIVANRKAKYLDAKLNEYCVDSGLARTDLVTANGTLNAERIGSWQPLLPVGTGYLPADAWLADRGVNPNKLTLAEIAKRVKASRSWILNSQQIPEKIYESRKVQIEELPHFGLYHSDDVELWDKLTASAAKLTPARQAQDLIDRAQRILNNPLVTYPRHGIGYERPFNEVLVSQYLLPDDLSRLNKLTALEGELNRISEVWEAQGGNRAELGELTSRARLRELNGTRIFLGGVVTVGNNQQLELKHPINFSDLIGALEVSGGPKGVYIYPPSKLEEIGIPLAEGSIRADTLASEWIGRAKILCTNSGKAQLEKAGFVSVERETFKAAQQLANLPNFIISSGFIEGVNRVLRGSD